MPVTYKRKTDRGANKQREKIIQIALKRHLIQYHPLVKDFFNDWAAGKWFPPQLRGYASERAAMASGRGWSDLFIPFPMEHTLADGSKKLYYGFFLEIKKEGEKIYVTDPKTKEKRLSADKQIRLEAAFLERMNDLGYLGMFGVGVEDCKRKLDWYLKRPILFDDQNVF